MSASGDLLKTSIKCQVAVVGSASSRLVDALDIVALEYRGRPGGGNLGTQCAPYRLGAHSLSKAQIDGGPQ